MRTTDFRSGMAVYSRDSVCLGRVTEVWAQTTSYGSLPVSKHLLQD